MIILAFRNIYVFDNIHVWSIFLPGRGDWKSSSRNFQAVRSCTLCQIWIFSISWSKDNISWKYLVVNQSWEKSSLHGCQLKSCRRKGTWAASQRLRKSWKQDKHVKILKSRQLCWNSCKTMHARILQIGCALHPESGSQIDPTRPARVGGDKEASPQNDRLTWRGRVERL